MHYFFKARSGYVGRLQNHQEPQKHTNAWTVYIFPGGEPSCLRTFVLLQIL